MSKLLSKIQCEHAMLKDKEALKWCDGYRHNLVSLTASNNEALLSRNCKPIGQFL